MRTFAKTLGLLALGCTIVPPTLFMFKVIALGPMQTTMLIATIVWFATAPLWLQTDSN